MSRAERRALVEREASALPVSRQCRLLAVSRASVYRRPAAISEQDCTIMALIDRQYLARPYYGARRMAAWLGRAGRAWRLSNTLGAEFCVEALEEALLLHGRPEIFNTVQGGQFTSDDFTGTLKRHEIIISMDGKGRYMDNIFVERLWRSL